jgi:DNA-binding beta-propeller fold protein YncE
MSMRYGVAAIAALAIQTCAANADIVALTGDSGLAMIDAKSGKVTGQTKIQGLGPVLGIDVRPSDGQLYALASDGTVATIDVATGKATVKSKLDTMPAAGTKVTVDFNPVADRMRVIGSDGANLRANVDDGKVTKDQPLKFAETDAAKGKTPMIVAGGYTNSMKGAKETTLYDVDGVLGGLFRQAPPNDGVLNTIGALGVDAKGASFDIMTDGAGANMAMLLAGKKLYSVDLASGKVAGAKEISGLSGQVNDIAVLPAM